MSFRSRRLRLAVTAAFLAVTLSACLRTDLQYLAQDALGGRDNGTAGSASARAHLVERLRTFARGAVPGRTGDAAFLQPFSGGTNVLAVIPGTDLADEYVIVGGHYDHVGSSCEGAGAADSICNGATDNAAGAAAVVEVGRMIAESAERPRRSIVLALWDREEDGLLGAAHYRANPVVPLADTVAYVNFDILGANLLPTLRSTTFAIASETGGRRLSDLVAGASAGSGLEVERLSSVFGQFRSDYAVFQQAGVPTVFFSDSTGGCYHTVDDEYEIVDLAKLRRQTNVAAELVERLAATGTPPVFDPAAASVSFSDAVNLLDVFTRSEPDLGRFSSTQQADFRQLLADLRRIVAAGQTAFTSADANLVLGGAARAVSAMTTLPCDGFLAD